MPGKQVVMFDKGPVLGQQIEKDWAKEAFSSLEDELVLVRGIELNVSEQLRPDLVLLVSDSPDKSFEESILERCRALDIKVLPVLGRASTVVVGPLEIPGQPGCATCLQLRWKHSRRRSLHDSALETQFGALALDGIRIPLTCEPSKLSALSTIIITEVASFLSTTCTRLQGTVAIHNRNAEIQWVPLLPSHDCPRCGLSAMDSAKLGQLSFQSHQIVDIDELRVRDVELSRLENLFVNEDVGYISNVQEFWSEDGYVRVNAGVSTRAAGHFGYGSGFSIEDAKKKAVLEVIERVCSTTATDRNPVVFDSYLNLQNMAIDPWRFGLHTDFAYETQMSGLKVYHADTKYFWVWAYSTMFNKPVLIPQQVAYYGQSNDTERFVVESSNGCALGGTLEEAILHGLFEVIERDGYLNMWYGKLPVPELRIDQHCPDKVLKTVSMLEQKGYRVRLFNISHDLHIPAVVATAELLDKNVFPRVTASSSCHLNPYEAAYGALRELAVQVLYLEGVSEKKRAEARAMFEDSSKMRDIMDHVLLAALPEAYSRWRFLLEREDDGQVKTIAETYQGVSGRYQMESQDIRLILNAVLNELHTHGFEVIVMNQTNVEASYADLHALKVLIPGMMPITFGHGLERWQGLQRIFELPYQMGYADHILTSADLNAYPHPFS
ncbi:TOMM precursor leader peptide-binding protein [Alicyclobacillus fodiniaquatilis]|uniref:TOMM leader peptide-binding protein n=1 Tax=Alicyclobacillus fodiniaquatilis TaxID=1661150 RepID=A0ABW4JD41_9BACL